MNNDTIKCENCGAICTVKDDIAKNVGRSLTSKPSRIILL